ncbi:glycosyltransferase [Amycolatopsis sp. NBC_00345]|uniref:glycosyltransferase n=1 Tax=Amycolatopsis sp. NBC_00345 TaxID=2975955 RepID=UPI002E2722A8
MRFALMTHGTRGDVQPLVALGAELARRGNTVELAVPAGSAALAERAGLRAIGLPGDWQQFLESPATDKQWLFSGDNAVLLGTLREIMAEHAAEIAKTLCGFSQGADVIVSGGLTEDIATVIAEALRVPLALVHTYPLRPTGAVANPLVTPRSSQFSEENLQTHARYEQENWKARRDGINRLRATLGLAATDLPTPERARALGAVEVQSYSAHVIPGLGWPRRRPVVGWIEPSQSDRAAFGESGVDSPLASWLDEGEAPAYFGFGSMPVPDPAAIAGLVERVSRDLGLRAVLSAGWAGLSAAAVEDGARVRVVGAVDHTALLPRCRLAVHHGGAGTTGAAVRAGLPTMICSIMMDQAMWGEQLQRLGSGVHVPFAELDEDTLRAGVARLLEPSVVTRARQLGENVRAEPDATIRAADAVTALAAASVS